MSRGRRAASLAATCTLVLCSLAAVAGAASGRTFQPGSLVLSAAQANTLCGGAAGAAGDNSAILPDGRIALECANGELIMYDLAGGYVAWSIDTKPYAEYAVGTQHVLLVSEQTVPAMGLQAATTTYTLTAKATSNGQTDWTVPFTDQGDVDSADDFSVEYEGPSGNATDPDETVLAYASSMTSFDSNTGATIWHSAPGGYLSSEAYYDQTGPYLGYGVNLAVQDTDDSDPSTYLETATSAASGATIWQQPVPAEAATDQNPTPAAIMPDGLGNVWLFWDDGYDERNIVTGVAGSSGAYPSDWDVGGEFLDSGNIYIDPPDVVFAGASQLELYNLNAISAPVWSVPANNVSVIAAGTQNALVSADTGDQIVSLTNGAIVAPASEDKNNQDGVGFGGWGTPVDGYLPFVGYSGISVLELEAPPVTLAKPSAAPVVRSPGLKWLRAKRHGRRTFVITGRLAAGATGKVALHLKRVHRSITRACKVSHRSIRCTVKLPISGAWSASLAYTSAGTSFRSATTGTHVLRAR